MNALKGQFNQKILFCERLSNISEAMMTEFNFGWIAHLTLEAGNLSIKTSYTGILFYNNNKKN